MVLASLLTATLMGPLQGAFASDEPADAGLNSVAASDFYLVAKNFFCPDGGGNCSPPPVQTRTVKCDPGDVAVGHSVWRQRMSDGSTNFAAVGPKAIGNPPDRYTFLFDIIGQNQRVFMRVICADTAA